MNLKIIVALSLLNSPVFIGAAKNENIANKLKDHIGSYNVYRKNAPQRRENPQHHTQGVDIYFGKESRVHYYEYDNEKKFKKIFEKSEYISKEENDILKYVLGESKAILERISGKFEIAPIFHTQSTYFSVHTNGWPSWLTMPINTADLTEEQKIDFILKMQTCMNPDWSLRGMILGYEDPKDCIKNLETRINNQVACRKTK
jgi:hypothetical protein